MKISINVSMARLGMILKEDVCNDKGAIIVSKGNKITEKILYALRMQSSDNIIVDVPEQEYEQLSGLLKKYEYEPKKIFTPNISYFEKVKNSDKYKGYEKKFEDVREDFKYDLEKMTQYNKYVPLDGVYEKTDFMLKDIESAGQLFDFIHIMRDRDESTYAHFLNVSMICNIFAKWLNLSEKDTEILTVAGTLHDVGKLQIPLEVLTKTGKLTNEEYEIIKTHTVKGYKILEKQDFDIRIKQAALMHHEKCDGTGYPLRTNINNTPDFVKIVGIADVYEAMTASRCYRDKVCPFVVIGMMEADGMVKYDPKYSMMFFEKIAYTYLGHEVKLNDGRKGKVAFINKKMLSKPIIIVGNDVVDTGSDPNIFITDMA